DVVAVAGDGDVVRHGQHVVRVDPAPARPAVAGVVEFAAPAETHALGVLRPHDFPWVAVAQPVVGFLDLFAVLDALAKPAVLIAYAIAYYGQAQRGAAVEKAGGEAAQAAVAEARVVLGLGDLFEQQAEVVHRAGGGVRDAEVEYGVVEGAAHQKFHRQIIGLPAAVFLAGVARALPALHQSIAHGQRQCLKRVVRRLAVFVTPQGMTEIAPEIAGNAGLMPAKRRKLRQFRHRSALAQCDRWHRLVVRYSVVRIWSPVGCLAFLRCQAPEWGDTVTDVDSVCCELRAVSARARDL